MADRRPIDALPLVDDLSVPPPIAEPVKANVLPRIRHSESPFQRILGPAGVAFSLNDARAPVPQNEKLRVDESAEPDDYDPTELALKGAPPWLVSLLVHMFGMIILALLMVPQIATSTLQLVANFADVKGMQLDEDVAVFSLDPTPMDDSIMVDSDLPMVDDPLMTPQKLNLTHVGTTPSSNFETPNIGVALNGRTPGMKNVLLLAYGGNETTEEAVQLGLKWLARNQKSSGLWSLSGPYADGVFGEDPTAATAMALLAFQGAGNTTKRGEYYEVVEKAWRAMLKMQRPNGDFWRGSTGHYRLYAQAQATIAVCEIYGMTKDSRFREPAQRAIDYAVKIQDPRGGGWRYEPGMETDTSVTGWFVMGLQSAQMAGLKVSEETWQRVSDYLDRAQHDDGARYGYRPGESYDHVMTAEGLLCRQYLGWPQSDQRLRRGIRYLNATPLDANNEDVYYWYYATQVYHHMGGPDWER